MKFKKLIGASLLLAFTPPLGAAPPTGIYTEDVDRAAQLCEDFYQYANGTWRAKNPIPPSMVRWSRRWASGELAKDQLEAILDDASRRTRVPKGSVEQLAGDH
jgi:putative endopeptidase